MRPLTANELWAALTAILPGFATDFCVAELANTDSNEAATLHSVMLSFTPYFGRVSHAMTAEQLSTLATLINESVSVDDDLENAISTCFLEHLRQVRSYRVLAPHLSSLARAKTHA